MPGYPATVTVELRRRLRLSEHLPHRPEPRDQLNAHTVRTALRAKLVCPLVSCRLSEAAASLDALSIANTFRAGLRRSFAGVALKFVEEMFRVAVTDPAGLVLWEPQECPVCAAVPQTAKRLASGVGTAGGQLQWLVGAVL